MSHAPPDESAMDFRPRVPGYWIRRYLPDKDAFVLAPVDGDSPELVAALDPQSPLRGRARETIMAALFGPRRSLAPVRLLVQDRTRRREKGPEANAEKILTITDAFQARLTADSDARKILDEKGRVITRWSEGLEDAVDHHGQIWLAQRALEFFAQIDEASFAHIRDRAAKGLPAEAAGALAHDFVTTLRGSESARQCRYHPNLPLRLQLGRAPSSDELANYAMQRAVVESFAEHAAPGTLADAQSALVSSRVLVAAPAARSPAQLRISTAEAARSIAAQLLAGLMELNGAEPASQEFDELWAPKPDGSFARRPSLHDEILREMSSHPIEQIADLNLKTQAYLALGRARLERYEAEARQLVAGEQAKTAAPAAASAASPLPPMSELFEQDLLPGETPPKLKRLKRVGRPVTGALDHAHKLGVEAETIPWF